MRRGLSAILLILLILCFFPSSSVKALNDPSETRYMRSDTIALDVTYFKLLTNNTDSYRTQSETWQTTSKQTQGYLRFLIYVFHSNYSFNLIATSSSIAVSGSTPTLYQANVSVPLTSLTITDRVYVQTQYSMNNSTWTSLGSARFITEQLGATILNAAEWTFNVYAAFESIYNLALRRWVNTIYLYFGDSTYPSRIENFSWSSEAVGEWHVLTFGFSLYALKWNLLNYSFNLTVKQQVTTHETNYFPSFVFFMFALSIVITFICVFPVYRRRGHKNV